jgi:hypothetical protein
MKMRVQLEGEEVVDDWSEFRVAFEKAAADVGLEISLIVHTNQEI